MVKKQKLKLINFAQRSGSLLSQAINISSHEWQRVIACWLLKFFLQVSLVIGGTLLIALFVDKFGVEHLPKLFVFQSISVILGVAMLSSLAGRIERKTFISACVIIAGFSMAILFFVSEYSAVFFSLYVFTLSVLIAQISIVLSLYIEELFTPLESERTFPVIESSEPIGSLAAGLLIVGILGMHIFSLEFLLIISAFLIFLMVPVLWIFISSSDVVPKIKTLEEIEQGKSKSKAFSDNFKLVRLVPFLKILALLVFMQFFIANILEFQFTKAVDSHIGGHNEDHASALTHSLGTVHVVISLLLLFSQLIVFSRVLKFFGVVRTIALKPILTTLSFVVMALNFTFLTAVGAKAVFEIAGNLFRNAHQVSFFALKERMRTQAKEFLEGISRPLGAVCGTLLILFYQFVLPEYLLNGFLNITLIVLGVIMFMMLYRFSEKHTLLARKNLEILGTPQEKLDAIEVLAQKGHKNASEILTKKLLSKKDAPEIRVKILKTLSILKDINALPVILDCFESKHEMVQLAAVEALGQYENLGKHFLTQSFARHRVIHSLKTLFIKTNSKRIKTAIINTLTHTKDPDFIPFLLDILKSPDVDIRSSAIFACGLFHDPAVAVYLEKFLHDPAPNVRANAIIALWQFVPLRIKLIIHLTKLLESKKNDDLLAGIFALGEIKLEQEKDRLLKYLESQNQEVKIYCAIALGKIKHNESVGLLADIIWASPIDEALKIKNKIRNIHPEIKEKIDKQLVRNASKLVADILQYQKFESIEEMKIGTLKMLLNIYSIISAEKEILRIREELERREKARACFEERVRLQVGWIG